MNRTLPRTRPRDLASGKKWKLPVGMTKFWKCRGWQLVLSSLSHVPLIYCGVKKITPELSGFKQQSCSYLSWFLWIRNSGTAWLGDSFQVSNAIAVRESLEQCRAGSPGGWSGVSLSKSSQGRLSLWVSLGFLTAWQPQSIWIAYTTCGGVPQREPPQGIKMNVCGIFMAYPWQSHNIPPPYTLVKAGAGASPGWKRSHSLDPISQCEQRKWYCKKSRWDDRYCYGHLWKT